MNRQKLWAWAAIALPSAAWGHVGAIEHSHAVPAFLSGVAHPLFGLDHAVALFAVGAWSAFAVRRVWIVPALFVAFMSIGAVWAVAHNGVLPAIEPMITASLMVLGLLIVAGTRVSMFAGAVLAAVFAWYHGFAHGAELASPHVAYALAGMVVGTVFLHACGVAIGHVLRGRDGWRRVLGGAVAVLGVGMFAAVL